MGICVVCNKNEAVAGVSKRTGKPYDKCPACYRAKRQEFLDRIGFDREARKNSLATFKRVWNEAWGAGLIAGRAHCPTPMVVQQHANPMDDSSPVVQEWGPIEGGVCGFANVCVAPANCSFAKWLRENYRETNQGFDPYSDYHKCVMISVSEYGQSYERKCAHARAVADYLKQHVAELTTGKTAPRFSVWDRLD